MKLKIPLKNAEKEKADKVMIMFETLVFSVIKTKQAMFLKLELYHKSETGLAIRVGIIV